jgi:hypothetical protein
MSYPSGGHMPFCFDAAILSRIPVPLWNRNGEGDRQIERDRGKDVACKALGYPLIRVPSYGHNPLAVMGRNDLAKLLDALLARIKPGEFVRLDEAYVRALCL